MKGPERTRSKSPVAAAQTKQVHPMLCKAESAERLWSWLHAPAEVDTSDVKCQAMLAMSGELSK